MTHYCLIYVEAFNFRFIEMFQQIENLFWMTYGKDLLFYKSRTASQTDIFSSNRLFA